MEKSLQVILFYHTFAVYYSSGTLIYKNKISKETTINLQSSTNVGCLSERKKGENK